MRLLSLHILLLFIQFLTFFCQFCGFNAALEGFLPNKNSKILIINTNVVKLMTYKYGYWTAKCRNNCKPSLIAAFHLIRPEKPRQGPRFSVSVLYFLSSIPSFFQSCVYFFSLSYFHFCLFVRGFRGCFCWFLHRGMSSMTEMACATSPSSAFVAAAFGASSSSVRQRYQTVGPLYVCQAGWATLPHSYYALDYCSPK